MNYPQLANWITFKKVDDSEYLVTNFLTDEEYAMDLYTVWYAKKLNGQRDPYRIDSRLSEKDVTDILDDLEEKDMLRQGKVISRSLSSIYVTVWIPKITATLRIIAYIINKLLLILLVPLLCYSIYHFRIDYIDFGNGYFILGTIIGILVGIVLHELGHMFACLAYGGRVFEIGVMVERFIPGAYVLMDINAIKKRMQRIQVDAAGIEMNLLITTFALILASNVEYFSGFFLGVAINNVFLALLNLLFINGFDGSAIISEIFGTEIIVEKAKEITKRKGLKKQMLNKGVSGVAIVIFCYLLRAFQISLPILFFINILGVIQCFL